MEPRIDEELEILHPGPLQTSLLTRQPYHQSEAIWNGEDPGPLMCRGRTKEMANVQMQDNQVIGIIKLLKLEGLFRAFSREIDHYLISALIERWRPETHTFHLPHGEMSITLQDVEVIFGLPIDAPLPHDATEIQIHQYVRCYILVLLGDKLFMDKLGDRVHLMFLEFMRNLRDPPQYSWGSDCLAWLYRELCRASEKGASQIGGACTLVQYWAWARLCGSHMRQTSATFLSSALQGGIRGQQRCRLCFCIVERYHPDHVLRQFGLAQEPPDDVVYDDRLHRIDLHGKVEKNWREEHGPYIISWEMRRQQVCHASPLIGEMPRDHAYYLWYRPVTQKYVNYNSAKLDIMIQSHLVLLEMLPEGSQAYNHVRCVLNNVAGIGGGPATNGQANNGLEPAATATPSTSAAPVSTPTHGQRATASPSTSAARGHGQPATASPSTSATRGRGWRATTPRVVTSLEMPAPIPHASPQPEVPPPIPDASPQPKVPSPSPPLQPNFDLGPLAGIDTLQPHTDVPDKHPLHQQPSPPRGRLQSTRRAPAYGIGGHKIGHRGNSMNDDEPKDDAPQPSPLPKHYARVKKRKISEP
uniref:Aminotransferase-like plant mobile domain-containing protein n=1 Tax=Quercus lobata TaxID=97700 RepID=A0A7N2LQC6_QUELO